MEKTAVIATNAAWNIANFRMGLVRGLQEQGWTVAALAPPDAHSSRLVEAGVRFLPIAMDKGGASPARDLLLYRRYLRALKGLRPDIYLGYTAKPNVYGTLAAQRLGIPTINNVSGLGTAFLGNPVLRRIVSGLYRRAFRKTATVFFQNEEDLGLFIGEGLVRKEVARLLPGSGIDLGRFAPSGAPARAGKGVTFLLIARLMWDKGVGEFIEAARDLRAQGAEASFQLLGFLDVENRSAVSRDDVDQWAAEGLVEYLGSSDDVRPFIAAADCVVLPSYREGLPRTLLEASAMARPLIATDVPGCRQVVVDGTNGFLCRVRDPGSLADAMRRMLALPAAEREQLGRNARQAAEQRYDENLVIARYLEAIEEATALRR
jgi:glycosyltransferase involved in cell wall biosynthesis